MTLKTNDVWREPFSEAQSRPAARVRAARHPDPAKKSRPTLHELARRAGAAGPSTPDVIAAVLREAIVSGALSGGEQLRQGEVASNFGVSVIPVREALRQLVAEGFVVFKRNRGAIVAQASVEEVAELFELRFALEPMLMRIAMPNLTPSDIEEAARHQRALQGEEQIEQWGRLNWLFHEALYRPAGRPRTLAIVANLNRHVDRLVRLQMSLSGGTRKSDREHGAILAACRKGDTERAVALLEHHIRGIESIILSYASKQASSR